MKYIADVLYGLVEVSDLALKFIDTEEFQRLRNIKQLSFASTVYPSACHTRFAHSIGTYHLACTVMKRLQEQQPSLNITKRQIELVSIAALLHDVGHVGAASHTMDHSVIPFLNVPKDMQTHERRSVVLLKHMVKKYGIEITEGEQMRIAAMILGEEVKGEPKFLYQLVSNHACDFDRSNYMALDSLHCGIPLGFSITYLLNNLAVTKAGELAFRRRVAFDLYCAASTRFRFYKKIYSHVTVLAAETMFIRLMELSKDAIDLRGYFLNGSLDWLNITDEWLFITIAQCPSLKSNTEVQDLLSRFRKRDFYKQASSTHGNDGQLITVKRTISYCPNEKQQRSGDHTYNPLENTKFVEDHPLEPDADSFLLTQQQVCALLPSTFAENVVVSFTTK